jgi:hypothetical protein
MRLEAEKKEKNWTVATALSSKFIRPGSQTNFTPIDSCVCVGRENLAELAWYSPLNK